MFFNKTGNLNDAEIPRALRKGLKVKIPVQSQGHEKGKGKFVPLTLKFSRRNMGQLSFLGNYPPTPSLGQHFALSEK